MSNKSAAEFIVIICDATEVCEEETAGEDFGKRKRGM